MVNLTGFDFLSIATDFDGLAFVPRIDQMLNFLKTQLLNRRNKKVKLRLLIGEMKVLVKCLWVNIFKLQWKPDNVIVTSH